MLSGQRWDGWLKFKCFFPPGGGKLRDNFEPEECAWVCQKAVVEFCFSCHSVNQSFLSYFCLQTLHCSIGESLNVRGTA